MLLAFLVIVVKEEKKPIETCFCSDLKKKIDST